jgi:hypothetical protein
VVADLSSDQAQAAAAVGLILPVVLSIPLQSHWSSQAKMLFSLAAYGVSGVITALAAGSLTGSSWWQSALLTFLTSAVSHEKVWKPSGITHAIEQTTTLQRGTAGLVDEPDDVPGANGALVFDAYAAPVAAPAGPAQQQPAGAVDLAPAGTLPPPGADAVAEDE